MSTRTPPRAHRMTEPVRGTRSHGRAAIHHGAPKARAASGHTGKSAPTGKAVPAAPTSSPSRHRADKPTSRPQPSPPQPAPRHKVRGAHQRPLAKRSKKAAPSASKRRKPVPGVFKSGLPRRRLIALLIGAVVVFGAILARVTMLQTTGGTQYTLAGTVQRTQETVLKASRGVMFDRNGDELALSVPATTIFVNPKLVLDPDGTAAALATTLQLTPEKQQSLAAGMRAKDHSFMYVARQVDEVTAQSVLALKLAGVDSYREDARVVPGGDLARGVIGRTDIDGKGISGLEMQYNDLLTGTDGERVSEHDTHGNAIPGSGGVSVSAVPGEDLVLTLDRSIQFSLEQALLDQVSTLGARGGTAIVEEASTGNILAMASVRRDDDGEYHVTAANIAAVDCYEPGSVAKVVTASAAINENLVTPDTWFDVPYYRTFDRGTPWEFTIRDAEPHPEQSMSVRQILVESSNMGTILESEKLGPQKQWEYMTSFGLGQRTALDFPGESKGILKNWEDWQGTEKVTPSYGYGVCVPAIQLVGAVNVIANGGVYVPPRLVQATIGNDGTMTDVAPGASHTVITPQVAGEMNQLMQAVVCDGTATRAQVDGITIAGKTGTGVKTVDGKYGSEGKDAAYYSSFVGFFPAEKPAVTTLISIDEPPGGDLSHFGGTAAAPVFKAVVPTIMHQLGVQPPTTTGGCPKK